MTEDFSDEFSLFNADLLKAMERISQGVVQRTQQAACGDCLERLQCGGELLREEMRGKELLKTPISNLLLSKTN